MNLLGAAITTLGIVALALFTLPYGLILLVGLWWLWRRG